MIKGNRVILRSLEMNDLGSLNKLHRNREIKKSAMCHPFPVSSFLDQKWLEDTLSDVSNKSVYFAIGEQQNSTLIGFISLTNINWINSNCNFGIIIDSDFQGKGLGKEATKMALTYAFETLNLHKISLLVLETNNGAIKMYENLGFVKEGKLIDQYFCNSKYLNVIMMGLLKLNCNK